MPNVEIGGPYGSTSTAIQCRAPPMVIRHPHYPVHENTLLRLPRLDKVTKGGLCDFNPLYGISHETLLVACQIITGNAQGIYLSYDAAGRQLVTIDPEGVLTHDEYYLQVPRQQGDNYPFPVICDFEDWQFPHKRLPTQWLCVGDELMESRSTVSRCLVFGNKGKPTLLLRQGSSPWLHRNRMNDYLALGNEQSDYEDPANVCHLRVDITEDFNRRAFALVPKMTSKGYRLVVNYVSAANDLNVPANIFHNSMIHPLGGTSLEFLYARFAYAVFGLVEGFARTTVRRLGSVEPGLDGLGLPTWAANVVSMTADQLAARRANMMNSVSKKTSAEEAGLESELIVWKDRMPKDNRKPGPFTFASFPANARLKIWEATWPDPRVIKIRSLPQIGSDVISDLSRLQLQGTVRNWLDEGYTEHSDDGGEGDVGDDDFMTEDPDYGGNLNNDINDDAYGDDFSLASSDSEDLEREDAFQAAETPRVLFWQMAHEDQHPVALSVCAESRQHTLKNFYHLRHQERSDWSFYLNPKRDDLWLPDSLWNWCADDGDAARLAHVRTATGSHMSSKLS
ncbi:hypothetical protein FSARC_2359 [Fusarium sarcochroum]|uniref:2EXR domain-containing protein n=1 Tax=Fusarium sarcochroum TaxID=1208366 RepID=A0A8H4XDZ7_9HYPO|nr:hypothetical protein FSARC_2359 [Fusarium sarcochroum]